MNAPKVGEHVAVQVARVDNYGWVHVETVNGEEVSIPPACFRPLPPSLSDEARAVLDAGLGYLRRYPKGIDRQTIPPQAVVLLEKLEVYAATLPPPKPVDPLKPVQDALNAILRRADRDHTGCNPDLLGADVCRLAHDAHEALAAVASARMGDGA